MKNLLHIREEDKKTSEWSGGSTTEFYIYPPTATYRDRNFLFRLSSATVNEETSVFTFLPEYNRILLVLKGKLRLVHEIQEGAQLKLHHESNLMPLEQDSFEGGYHTVSYGTCVDFNLMTAEDLQARVTVITLKKGEQSTLTKDWANFVYVVKGKVSICQNHEKEYIMENELGIFLPDDEMTETVAKSNDTVELLADSEDAVIIAGTIANNLYER